MRLAFGIPPNEQDILRLVRRAKSPAVRAYFVFMAVVLAPAVAAAQFAKGCQLTVPARDGLVLKLS